MKKIAAFLEQRPFCLFVLFLLLAYLPVFLPFFHVKNDLVTQNLPTRFVISESLYSGYFPWWNPYINFGIPQYGDMNGGYWNPLLWLIARTTGYGIWAITLEEMFYVLMGAWGIYLLCKEQQTTQKTAILTGLSYMCGGYILGHLQHFCWITGTAAFPYVLLYFIRVHKSPLLKNYLTGGLFVFLWTSATHPGLIIGGLYFFLFLTAAIYLLRKDLLRDLWHPKFFQVTGTFLLISLLLSLVVIVSDGDVLRHIPRGHKVSLDQSLLDPTTFPSYLSLLFPLAVQTSNLFHTDISMRNAYIGLLPLCFFILFCLTTPGKGLLTTASALLFFVLLSAGGLFKTFAWHYLPLTGHVRLNGEFSYFVGLILLLAGAAGFEAYQRNDRYKQKGDQLLRWLQGICLLALAFSVCLIFFRHSSLLYEVAPSGKGFKEQIKWTIDHLHFADLLALQSLIQLVTLTGLLSTKPLTSFSPVLIIVMVNGILISWLTLPFTGLGMASKANRQELISQFPKGIHAPEQWPLNATVYLDSSYARDLILLGSYSKKIGYIKEKYPVELNTTSAFFKDTALVSFIRRQSYLFLSKDTVMGTPTDFDSARIHIRQFGPGCLKAVIDNKDYHYLTFLQNDYPYWKIRVNGQLTPHFRGFRTFLTIPLPPGEQEVEFYFDPTPVRTALILHGLILAAALGLLWNKKTRDITLFRR
ncbi:MAG TPA: hypothetical protein VL832_29380 [Puia sp.]|nr:hypothetical protein [Puia sp.]